MKLSTKINLRYSHERARIIRTYTYIRTYIHTYVRTYIYDVVEGGCNTFFLLFIGDITMISDITRLIRLRTDLTGRFPVDRHSADVTHSTGRFPVGVTNLASRHSIVRNTGRFLAAVRVYINSLHQTRYRGHRTRPPLRRRSYTTFPLPAAPGPPS
jgi:hypothetical protein